jgi:hypothetical protein
MHGKLILVQPKEKRPSFYEIKSFPQQPSNAMLIYDPFKYYILICA